MLRAKSAIFVEAKHRKTTSTLVSFLASAILCTLFTVGCSSIPNTLSSSSSAPAPRNVVTSLPDGIVGTSYDSALSNIGGTSRFRFSVTQGELPSGLGLNSQTGQISGTPTQAGRFSFTIAVVSEPARAFREHGYNVTVRPCAKCVTLQITPITPSVAPGGHIQFSAMLTDTGNTAVNWSASSGTISSTGLFTAPTHSASKPVVVKATSVAHQGVQAETSVSITNNTALVIQTARVPPAVSNEPYSAVLTATGGHPPYTWTISSGSLPAGVKLNSTTGTLSGLPTRTGTFAFTVRGSDTKADTAQRTFSLPVSGTQGSCGPPTYNCSRTDLSTVQLPQTPPSVGNLIGANTIVVDPDFHNRIVRITDARTNPNPIFVNRTFVSSSSGSADDNLWNLDSTLFLVMDTGSNGYPFSFNPSTMQASRMYVSNFPSTNGLMVPSSGIWSRVDPTLLYTFSGTSISKYNFSDRTKPPTAEPVFKFTSSTNCLPSQFTSTWSSNGGVSADDKTFGAAFSNSGNQGTGTYAVAYRVGSGCTMLNTQTGQVSGDWGVKGTINIPDRWTIHNVKLAKDGNWLIIVPTNCTAAPCSAGPYYWQIGTTNVTSCGQGGLCSGHWTEGYSHWVNCNNSPMANQVIRSFAVAASARSVGNDLPSGIVGPLDQHQSWNNVDPMDSVPFFSSTWSNRKPFPAPWYNEIIAVAADGSGKTWRFAHTFITGNSQIFSTQYAIGTVSQDGRFFIFSSDWMGRLGSESGTASCAIGTNCRGDVFVVELK